MITSMIIIVRKTEIEGSAVVYEFRNGHLYDEIMVGDHWMISLSNGFIMVVAEGFIPEEYEILYINDEILEKLYIDGVIGNYKKEDRKKKNYRKN